MKKEIEALERSESYTHHQKSQPQKNDKPQKISLGITNGKSSAAGLLAASSKPSTPCCFCNRRNHRSDDCREVINLNNAQKVSKFLEADVCFKCVSKQPYAHFSKDCPNIAAITCKKCKGKHSQLMCGVKWGEIISNMKNRAPSDQNVPAPTHPTLHSAQHAVPTAGAGGSGVQGKVHIQANCSSFTACTVLQTASAPALVEGKPHVKAKILFDSGAEVPYISTKFLKKINAKWLNRMLLPYSAFGGATSTDWRNIYQVQLLAKNGSIVELEAAEISTICAAMYRPAVPVEVLGCFSQLDLADDYASDQPMEIDLVIGLRYYWQLLTVADTVEHRGIVALKSVFGYVLSGCCDGQSALQCPSPAAQLLCPGPRPSPLPSNAAVEQMWDLEAIGVYEQPSTATVEEELAVKQFSESVRFDADTGRYEVALPWRSEEHKQKFMNKSMNNERLVKKLFDRMSKNLNRDFERKKEYYDIFDTYEKNDIIEEVTNDQLCPNPVYYLPHRPHINERNETTPVRPVFNAGFKGYNNFSLNDALLCGPNLNPEIPEVLLRFKMHKVAISSDIRKAFLNVQIKEEERDVHRFFLESDEGYRTMRFVTLPFGNTSSPFLLAATLKHHLNQYQNSECVQSLKSDMYVDNWVSGASNISEAYQRYCEATDVMNDAHMPLTKWYTNDQTLQNVFSQSESSEEKVLSVLGLSWANFSDKFQFNLYDFCSKFNYQPTKRSVLSSIASLYDPLGMLSPFVMFGKLLFQDLWIAKIDWNDTLPIEIKNKYDSWLKSGECLKSFFVNRMYFPTFAWSELRKIDLHLFTDASERGYGCCVYIRALLPNNEVSVQLVCSRSRVCPIKFVTLPKLELLSAFIGARLLNYVVNAMYLHDCPKYCYSDSTITLDWINSNPMKKDIFLYNRVTEILRYTTTDQWYHCKGKENPADLITRGALADKVVNNKLWFHGPEWLHSYCELPPYKPKPPEIVLETVPIEAVQLNVQSCEPFLDVERFSSFDKMVRVVAYVRRFLNNKIIDPNNKITGSLSHDEIEIAKKRVLLSQQKITFPDEYSKLSNGKAISKNSPLFTMDPYIDSDGLIRVRGRLEKSQISFESKHPIILPKSHLSKLIIRSQHLLMNHVGVEGLYASIRSQYWIIKCKKICKSVIRECLNCKKLDSKPMTQGAAQLPKDRITPASPFSITGLDYAGPLYCADFPQKKFYFLLFTCAVIRGIHIELTESMKVSDTMLAIRRFVSRRGMPEKLYSDNAKTFKCCKDEIMNHFGANSPKWEFITPVSPHQGGWWERLVRSVKSALKKTLGIKYLLRTELETVLIEIESCVNSRPLTYTMNDLNVSILTPGQFIIGRTTYYQSTSETDPTNLSPTDLYEKLTMKSALLSKFWNLWSKLYITNLPPIVKNFKKQSNIKVGNVVMIKDENSPRMCWPLGVVSEVYPGTDGLVRNVRLKTAKGYITRSVQKLYDLEIYSDHFANPTNSSAIDENMQSSDSDVPVEIKTRSGRIVKPVTKY